MRTAFALEEHTQTTGEEIANSISHGLGLLACTIAVPFLIATAVQRGAVRGVVGVSIFAVALVLVYLTSTLYHALPTGRAKRIFRFLDHEAIFVLIAGTYTPFTLGVLRGAWGWALFGVIWGLAVVGAMLKTIDDGCHQKLSIGLYLTMGWLALVAVQPLWLKVPVWGLFWLLTGGVAYTLGLFFFVSRHIRYNHFIWHLFVITGSACHFVAVLRYAL